MAKMTYIFLNVLVVPPAVLWIHNYFCPDPDPTSHLISVPDPTSHLISVPDPVICQTCSQF